MSGGKDPVELYVAALGQAFELQEAGKFDEAAEHARMAISLAPTKATRGKAYGVLGTIQVDQFNFALADKSFQEAERILRQDGISTDLGEVVYERANILYRLSEGNKEKRKGAEARYNEALKLAKDTGSHDLVCRCFSNLADMELEGVPMGLPDNVFPRELDKNRKQAEDYLQRAREAARKADSMEERGVTLLCLEVRVAAARNSREKARGLLSEAQRMVQRQGRSSGIEALKN